MTQRVSSRFDYLSGLYSRTCGTKGLATRSTLGLVLSSVSRDCRQDVPCHLRGATRLSVIRLLPNLATLPVASSFTYSRFFVTSCHCRNCFRFSADNILFSLRSTHLLSCIWTFNHTRDSIQSLRTLMLWYMARSSIQMQKSKTYWLLSFSRFH